MDANDITTGIRQLCARQDGNIVEIVLHPIVLWTECFQCHGTVRGVPGFNDGRATGIDRTIEVIDEIANGLGADILNNNAWLRDILLGYCFVFH
jgi:hypothetical protein